MELPGKYYIEAPLLGDSYSFQIADNLYDDVLKEAVKQYYYNRCGITLTEEFAGSRAHNACHTGYALLREDMSVSMDVSGGWHQDENGSKDVVRAAENISVMLLAYELFGDAFSDDMELPESRNGIPDLLDEIRYETDWLLKCRMRKPERYMRRLPCLHRHRASHRPFMWSHPRWRQRKALPCALPGSAIFIRIMTGNMQ